MDLRLNDHFSMCLSGSSGCGKTHLIYELIKTAIDSMKRPPSSIIICYSCPQPIYQSFEKLGYPLELIQGLPTAPPPENSLVIFDDLQHLTKEIEPYFTKLVHHLRVSCIYITQNLFLKHNRTITLNSQYIALFKSPRDKRQIQNIATQMSPRNSRWIIDSYNMATRNPHSYLLFDFLQSTDDCVRVRDGIIPGESSVYVNSSEYTEHDLRGYK